MGSGEDGCKWIKLKADLGPCRRFNRTLFGLSSLPHIQNCDTKVSDSTNHLEMQFPSAK